MKINTSVIFAWAAFAMLFLSGSNSFAQDWASPVILGCSPPPSLTWEGPLVEAKVRSDVYTVLRVADKERRTKVDYVKIFNSEDLSIAVEVPHWVYRSDHSGAQWSRRLIDTPYLPAPVYIVVSAARFDSANIVKVGVERSGKTVSPIEYSLTPTGMTTTTGPVRFSFVSFPCAAFSPGALVTLTAFPALGENIVKTFTSQELTLISGVNATGFPASISGDLVGMSTADVEAGLGSPRQVDGVRWTYQSNDVTFYLYVSSNRVESVRPDDAPLETLRVR